MKSKGVEKEVITIDLMKSTCDCVNTSYNGKTQRKQEASEWKALRRIDYQRLETVLEEVHLSCEKTISDRNNDSNTLCEDEVNKKKAWFCRPLPKTENTEQLLSEEENERQEEVEEEEPFLNSWSYDSDSKINFVEAQEELVDSGGRRKILSGIMELLPIFSNDKFVCSKDAISVQECDMDSVEKASLPSGKPLLGDKNSTDGSVFIELANSEQKVSGNRFTDPKGNLLEIFGRIRSKTFSEMNVSSSHFINFLLIITQFSNEKKKFLAVNSVPDCGSECSIPRDVLANQIVGETLTSTTGSAFQIFCKMIFTLFGLMSVIMCIFWKFHEPTNFTKCFLCFTHFFQRKRTYCQKFFDNTMKIMTNIFEGICI